MPCKGNLQLTNESVTNLQRIKKRKKTQGPQTVTSQTVVHLLHRVRLFKEFNSTVATAYSNYIRKNFVGRITGAFDEYYDEGAKSHKYLHQNSVPQRHKEKSVPFTEDHFLSNKENKFLSSYLKQSGCETRKTGQRISFSHKKLK